MGVFEAAVRFSADSRRFAFRKVAVFSTVCAAIGAAFGYLDAFREPPQFSSIARVLVVDSAANEPADDGSRIRHSEAIVSVVNCESALRVGQLNGFECIRTSADPVAALQSKLSARAIDDTKHILELRFVAGRRNEPHVVLDAVLESYQHLLGDDVVDEVGATLQEIVRLKSDLHESISRREAAYAGWTAAAPDYWRGPEEAAERRVQLDDLKRRRLEFSRIVNATQRRTEIESNSEADSNGLHGNDASVFDVRRKSPTTQELSPSGSALDELFDEEFRLLKRYGPGHPQVINVRARIEAALAGSGVETAETKLRAEEKLLSSQFGPAHPKVREVRAKLAELNALPSPDDPATTLSPAADAANQSPMPPERIAPADMESLESEITKLDAQIAALQVDVDRRNGWEEKDRLFREEIDRLKRMFDAATMRLKYLEDRSGEPVKRLIVLQPPTEAVLVERDTTTPTSIGMLVGAAAGVFLSSLRGRPSVRTAQHPNTLELLASIRVDGLCSKPVDHSRQLGDALAVVRRSGQPIGEAFRHLRTTLEFRTDGERPLICGFVSATLDEEHVWFLANLGAAFALSGKRVLILDTTPTALSRRLLGESSQSALKDVAAGRAELIDAVTTTDITGMHVCRELNDRRESQPTMMQCSELRSLLQTKYDYVLTLERLDSGNELLIGPPDAWAIVQHGAEPINDIEPLAVRHRDGKYLGIVRLERHAMPGSNDASLATEAR